MRRPLIACNRPGDLARIEEHSSGASTQKKATKPKKSGTVEKTKNDGVEGVVYKVH